MQDDYVAELHDLVERASPRLLALGDEAAARRPAPEKWSAKEIVGHLIDSASNNHQRFVRAQLQDDLVFDGYDQEAWVARQRYEDAPWEELVGLWKLYNLHLVRLMRAVPEIERLRGRPRHNLDQLAWKPVSRDEQTTLDYFMRDYVGHLRSHLVQILGPE